MINEILQDLINTSKVVSFINDMIVEIKKEKEHDEVVEKVVKKLAENDLYMKPEKCKWKMREVGFLRLDQREKKWSVTILSLAQITTQIKT